MGVIPRQFFCAECVRMRWPGDCGHRRIVSALPSLSTQDLAMMVSDRRQCGHEPRQCACKYVGDGPMSGILRNATASQVMPIDKRLVEAAMRYYTSCDHTRLFIDETREDWVVTQHFVVYAGEELARSMTKREGLECVNMSNATTEYLDKIERDGPGEEVGWANVRVDHPDGALDMIGFRTAQERIDGIQYPTIVAPAYARLVASAHRVCRSKDGNVLGDVSGWSRGKLVAVVMPRRNETVV